MYVIALNVQHVEREQDVADSALELRRGKLVAGELGEEGGPGPEEGLLDEDVEGLLLGSGDLGEDEGGDCGAEVGVACGEDGLAFVGFESDVAEDVHFGAGDAVPVDFEGEVIP